MFHPQLYLLIVDKLYFACILRSTLVRLLSYASLRAARGRFASPFISSMTLLDMLLTHRPLLAYQLWHNDKA